MASTSLTLGTHWERFIEREVKSGRFTTASEVVRAALRELEERGNRIEALRTHLDQGAAEAARGDFIEYSAKGLLRRARAKAALPKVSKAARRAT